MASVTSAHWLNDSKKVVLSLIGIIVQVYLTMILISYSPNDPSWSHVNSDVTSFANMGGARGAWLADLLITFIGRASWLLVAYALYEVILLWWRRRIIFGGLRAVGYLFLLLGFSAFLTMKTTIGQQVVEANTGNLVIPMSLADNMLASGGIVGYELAVRLQLIMARFWTWLFLLLFLFATATLAFDIRWKPLLVNIFNLSWLGTGLSAEKQREMQDLANNDQLDESELDSEQSHDTDSALDSVLDNTFDKETTIIDLSTGKPQPRYQPFDYKADELGTNTDNLAQAKKSAQIPAQTPAKNKKGANELEDFLLQSGLATEAEEEPSNDNNAIEASFANEEVQTTEQSPAHTSRTQVVNETPKQAKARQSETADTTKPSSNLYPFGNKTDKNTAKQTVIKQKVEPTFDWNNPQMVEHLLSDNPASDGKNDRLENEPSYNQTKTQQLPQKVPQQDFKQIPSSTPTQANYQKEFGLNFDYSDGSDIFSTMASSVSNIQSEDFAEQLVHEPATPSHSSIGSVPETHHHDGLLMNYDIDNKTDDDNDEGNDIGDDNFGEYDGHYIDKSEFQSRDFENSGFDNRDFGNSQDLKASQNRHADSSTGKTPSAQQHQQHQQSQRQTATNHQNPTDGYVTPTKDDDPFAKNPPLTGEYVQEYDKIEQLHTANDNINDNNEYDESQATHSPHASHDSNHSQTIQDKLTQPTINSALPDIHDDEAFAGKSRAFQTAKHRQKLSPIPPLDILEKPDPDRRPSYTRFELGQLSELLEIKLQDFNVKAEVVNAIPGPVVTRFEVELAPGVKASKVVNISRDLARSLSMASLRVVEVIPGKPYIGIEVPNKKREMVRLIELLDTDKYRDPNGQISMAMGKDIGGKPIITDLAKAPHMLVAGTTGSGKSVLVNSMLLSILLKYKPDELRLILIDPKQLELANYNDIPHLLTPVVTDMTEAAGALSWCVQEMERRYQLMSLLRVRKLKEFNKKVLEAEKNGNPIIDPLWRPNDSVSIDKAPKLKPLPMIVIVADEFADMMMQVGKQAEELITRLAQKSRAAGIHLMLATQRPSVDVITGLIKANVPVRAALRVNSKVDSRTILDAGGAEDMLGNGDMLFLGPGQIEPDRVHGAFVSDEEVNQVCEAWRERGDPDYIDNFTENFQLASPDSSGGSTGGTSGEDDAFYNEAVAFILETRKVSASSIQRKFSIGYNRAARIVDSMEQAGIVGPMIKGKREILV